ncbi:MAG: MoaD/ThiS family protein [Alphaproteobacteria bacterium]|nr:MoaD/ThiS family protein [Alphaproteobacteria bacterium]
MPEVWIPTLMRSLSAGQDRVQVEGSNVRQVIENLDKQFPGMKQRLMEDGRLMPGISVIVDGQQSQLGLLERLEQASEVHFLPAIGGGL